MTKETFDIKQKAIVVSVDVELDGMIKDFPFIVDIGLTRCNFKVISHPMPSGSGAYGLLGLDFFENTKLTIDFKTAEITVE